MEEQNSSTQVVQQPNQQQAPYSPPQGAPQYGPDTKVCPKCQGIMTIQAVAEMKKRGILTILLYLILLCIPIVGWFALFSMIRGRKSKTISLAVCQGCGHRIKM